ncbi:MAG TPA: thioredoxin family protein [Stellaceae bacterium]|nr:thioredoxin family protein [Stellaceae bacterium]
MIPEKIGSTLRKVFLSLLTATLLAAPGWAAERANWSQAAFSSAQDAGKSIIVEVTAPWCPICAKQKPTIATLEGDPEFAHSIIFSVDFDSQKDALEHLHVSMQSTLIVFKGKIEEGRSTGVTDPAAIRALFERAL